MAPKWLSVDFVLSLHDHAIAGFGGSYGVRDLESLESALERGPSLYVYGDDPTIFQLAAALSAGIARNHPFLDGNKRTALLVARAFLFLNGYLFEAKESEEVAMMIALAEGSLDESRLADWLADNATVRQD